MPKKRPIIEFKGFGSHPAEVDDSQVTEATDETPVPGDKRMSRHYGTDDGDHPRYLHRHREHHRRHRDADDYDDDYDRDEQDRKERKSRHRTDDKRRHRHRDNHERHPHRHHRHHRTRDPDYEDLDEGHHDDDRDEQPQHRHKHKSKHRHRSRSHHRHHEHDPDVSDEDRVLDHHRRRARHRHHHRDRDRDIEARPDDPYDEEPAAEDEQDLPVPQTRTVPRGSLRDRHHDELGRPAHSERSRDQDSNWSGRTKHPHKSKDGQREYGYDRVDYRDESQQGSTRGSARAIDEDTRERDHQEFGGSARGGSHHSRGYGSSREGDGIRGSHRSHGGPKSSTRNPDNGDYPEGTYVSPERHSERRRSKSLPRGSDRVVHGGAYAGGRPPMQRPSIPSFVATDSEEDPGDYQRSRHGSYAGPGSRRGPGVRPGGMHGSGVFPGSMGGSGVLPGGMRGSAVLPGSMHGSAMQPGSMHGSAMRPGSMHGSAMQPVSMHGSAMRPGSMGSMRDLRASGIPPPVPLPMGAPLGPGLGGSRPPPPPGLAMDIPDDRDVAEDYAALVRHKRRRRRHRRGHYRSRRHRHHRHHHSHSKHRKRRRREESGSDSKDTSESSKEEEQSEQEVPPRRRRKGSKKQNNDEENEQENSAQGTDKSTDEEEENSEEKGRFTKRKIAKYGALTLLALGGTLLAKKMINRRKKKKEEATQNSEYMSGSEGSVSGGGHGYYHEPTYRPRVPPVGLFSVKVPQNQVCIVERGGRYHRKANPGSNFINPCMDRVAYCHSLRELAIPIPWEQCLTSDSIPLRASGMLHMRIEDPVAASYGVDNPYQSVILLAQTCTRNKIASSTKEEAFHDRAIISDHILDEMNNTCRSWGVRCLKFELRDLELPIEIQEKIHAEEEAERQHRQAVMQAEAERVAAIKKAEAELQVQLKASQARQLEIVNQAIGEAHAIQERGEAVANALRDVAEVVNEPGGQQAMQMRLAEQFIDAYAKAARAPTVPPPDPNNVASNMNNAIDLLNTLGEEGQSPQIPTAQMPANPFADPPTVPEKPQPDVQSGASSPKTKPKPIQAVPTQPGSEAASSEAGKENPESSETNPQEHYPNAPKASFYPQPGQEQSHQSTPSASASHDSRPHESHPGNSSGRPQSAKTKNKPQKASKGLKKLQARLEDKLDGILH